MAPHRGLTSPATMTTKRRWRPLPHAAIALLIGLAACGEGEGSRTDRAASQPDCFDPVVRETVVHLGERLRQVSLLAPDSLLRPEIQSAYGEFVTPALLARWMEDPSSAPGRQVSSPWPERIEVSAVEPAGDGGCRVRGEVVYSASADPGPPTQVVVTLERQGGWRIASYEPR